MAMGRRGTAQLGRSVRITNAQLSRNLLSNLNDTHSRLAKIQRQISSGKTINRPEDDPAKVVEILRFSAAVEDVTQFIRNSERSGDFMAASESALNTLTNALQRARELAVQGANGALRTADLTSIRSEVEQLFAEAISIGNVKFGDQFLFSGTKTTTQPFTYDSSTHVATYAGNANSINVEIDRGDTIDTNTPGSSVYTTVFTSLKSLIDNLAAADHAAVGGASLQQIDSALDGVLQSRAKVGARIQRVQAVAARLADLNVRRREVLSRVQDLDFAAGVTELAMAETAYRASLAAGARILQPSLLDFLR